VIVETALPDYEPRVIEQFAEKLYRKASAFVMGSVVVGGALGAAFGSVPLTSLGEAWPVPSMFGFVTLLLGGIFGAVIGYVIGDTRSFGYRLQAQSALCQLQLERNTAVLAQAVAAARTAPPAQQARPAPTAAPATPPAQQAPRPTPPQPQPQAPSAPPVQQQPAPAPAQTPPQPAQQEAPAPLAGPPVTPPVSAARNVA
jgi:outer membrane biosynthesis protein TonB